jgi:membrane protease YdiL (CAAX protease family)
MVLIGATALYALTLGGPRAWHWNGSMRAWLLAGTVIALAAGAGFALHAPDTAPRPISGGHILRYLGWALMQQYLICVVCVERWRIATGNAALAVYLSAFCFALLHTPNASLMLATFIGGLCWCALYLRERALLPLACSHAASATLLLALLPPDILLSAEVSARFFQ